MRHVAIRWTCGLLLVLGGCATEPLARSGAPAVARRQWRAGSGAPAVAPPGELPLTPAQYAVVAPIGDFGVGVAAAEANIRAGRLEFHTYGFEVVKQSPYRRRYDAFLARHGVRFVNQGCELDPDSYMTGYAHRMAVEVLERHGADFWQRADQAARGGR